MIIGLITGSLISWLICFLSQRKRLKNNETTINNQSKEIESLQKELGQLALISRTHENNLNDMIYELQKKLACLKEDKTELHNKLELCIKIVREAEAQSSEGCYGREILRRFLRDINSN